METPDGKEAMADKTGVEHMGAIWTNDEKVELIRLRLQGITFEDIGRRMGRTKHAARSEYGRIRRGETDVTVSLRELPELRDALPVRKTK